MNAMQIFHNFIHIGDLFHITVIIRLRQGYDFSRAGVFRSFQPGFRVFHNNATADVGLNFLGGN